MKNQRPAGRWFQTADRVSHLNPRTVILRNEVTKNLEDEQNVEHFKILRLRFAPLRMTKTGFVYTLRQRLWLCLI